MARKQRPSSELLLLSASAVMVIYAAGYTLTLPGVEAVRQMTGRVVPPSVGARFRDGTYLAEGKSQFGSVFVIVAIERGRIAQVWINAVTTTFPPSVIASLPREVVERQTTAVDLVSGATASSSAFVNAVKLALQQARA